MTDRSDDTRQVLDALALGHNLTRMTRGESWVQIDQTPINAIRDSFEALVAERDTLADNLARVQQHLQAVVAERDRYKAEYEWVGAIGKALNEQNTRLILERNRYERERDELLEQAREDYRTINGLRAVLSVAERERDALRQTIRSAVPEPIASDLIARAALAGESE